MVKAILEEIRGTLYYGADTSMLDKVPSAVDPIVTVGKSEEETLVWKKSFTSAGGIGSHA